MLLVENQKLRSVLSEYEGDKYTHMVIADDLKRAREILVLEWNTGE